MGVKQFEVGSRGRAVNEGGWLDIAGGIDMVGGNNVAGGNHIIASNDIVARIIAAVSVTTGFR